MKILTLCLLTAVLTLLFPSHAMGQTPAQVQRAFTPLTTPEPLPRPRNTDQWVCDEASRRLDQQPVIRSEVLTDLVVQRFDRENAFHREAAYRWLAQELVRTNDETVPTSILEGGVGPRLMAYVRSEYTIPEIERLACSGRQPLSCSLSFAWTASFERGAWCAAVETARPSPAHHGFVPGTLDAHICIDAEYQSGALACHTDSRPLRIQARPVGLRTTTPMTIVSATERPVFATGWGQYGFVNTYPTERMMGMGRISTLGTGTGSGASSPSQPVLRRRTPLPTVRPARPVAAP